MKMRDAFKEVKKLADGTSCAVEFRITSYGERPCLGYIGGIEKERGIISTGDTWEKVIRKLTEEKYGGIVEQPIPDEEE
jgi:hypothetical protein